MRCGRLQSESAAAYGLLGTPSTWVRNVQRRHHVDDNCAFCRISVRSAKLLTVSTIMLLFGNKRRTAKVSNCGGAFSSHAGNILVNASTPRSFLRNTPGVWARVATLRCDAEFPSS